jgi:hypothetical protein
VSRANIAAVEGVSIVETTESTGTRSGRLPEERDSDFEAGAFGSLERHSQDPAGAESSPRSDADDVSEGALAERAGKERFAGLQQPGVQRRPTQQFRAPAFVAHPDRPAVASPAIDDIPTIVKKTIHKSRRWQRTVMIAPTEEKIAQIIALCLILASGSSLREGASPLI